MKTPLRVAMTFLMALALVGTATVTATADYPDPSPSTAAGQRVVGVVDGWRQVYGDSSVDAWELDGLAAHVTYLPTSILSHANMRDDLAGKMRDVGATDVRFTAVAVPYSTVTATAERLQTQFAAQFESGHLTSIEAAPGVAAREIQIAGTNEGITLARTQLGSSQGNVAISYSSTEVDLYLTEGTHNVNGRQWRTTCEPYSQTRRCRTEIQATTIALVDGEYVQSTGWAFNNLTYAPSPRELWAGNPLAANGTVGGKVEWTVDGRQWRTECDTALTGQNACRSFTMATFIAFEDGAYVQKSDWLFNNIVRFS